MVARALARLGAPVSGLVFDAYGTLFDLQSLRAACAALVPDPAGFLAEWRAKQLEYAFLRSLMERYADFWTVTAEALRFTLERRKVALTAEQREALLAAWLEPTPFPEVPAALERLQAWPLAVLSNGSPAMLRTAVERAGLAPFFRWLLSVDEVGVYKPSPRVYALAVERFGAPPERLLFVSSNGWDVAGARSFGLRACWVNRAGLPSDPIAPPPDLILGSLAELE